MKTKELWVAAGKGTENKMELDGFEHIRNHCVPSSSWVLWVDLASASQDGAVAWPQTEVKLLPSHSLTSCPEHNAGKKWEGDGEQGGEELVGWDHLPSNVAGKTDSAWFTVD